jgi:hypothetical protein
MVPFFRDGYTLAGRSRAKKSQRDNGEENALQCKKAATFQRGFFCYSGLSEQ